MEHDVLKKVGTLVEERDHYECGAYLYTDSFYYYRNRLYIHTEHSNTRRYTGKTCTLLIIKDVLDVLNKYDESFIERYGLSGDGIKTLKLISLENEQSEGNAIKDARLKAQLTVAEVGELLEVPIKTITSWEAGEINLPKWEEKLIIEKLNSLRGRPE